MSNYWQLAVVSILTGAVPAMGSSQVYEGFQYPSGAQPLNELDLGTGWAGAFTGSPSIVQISNPSLSNPAGLPSTGAALGITTETEGLSLQRSIASPISSGEEYWVSFLAERTDFPSSATLQLGGSSSARISFFIGGYGIVGDVTQFVPWPDFGSTSFMLLARFAPVGVGQQRIDVWLNPTGSLGPSEVSVVTSATGVNEVRLEIGSYTLFDELRIDRQLQNVYVPAAGSVIPLGVLAFAASRRRRIELI